MIEVKGLSKSFGDKEVLKNINLSIGDGDIYGIIGLSGEGKSTLVRCLNLLEKPSTGSITYSDDKESIDVLNLDGSKLREYRQKVSMIFQDFNLFNQKTVYQNVEYPLTLKKGYKKGSADERILELLNLVGLEEKINAYPSELSGGQKQRVAIARALVLEPSVILCDECTSALDPTTANQILDLLKSLNKKMGLTIIIIAHQMNVIERVCNKVAIISEHRIVEEGLVSDVFLSPKTEAAKRLVYSDNVLQELHDQKLIKFGFNGNTDEPILANIIKECNIMVSIVYANSWTVDGKVYGQIIISVPDYDKNIVKLRKYLSNKNVTFEEVK